MAINIRFKAIVDTLANIATDKFQGRIAWATNIARMIWYYDANNYGEMARRDVLETFLQGIQDSTGTSGRVVRYGASGRLQGDAGMTTTQNNGKTTTIFVGDGSSDTASPGIVLDGFSGSSYPALNYRSAGFTRVSARWENAEDRYVVITRNDDGTARATVLQIPRTLNGTIVLGASASQPMNIAGPLQVSGTQRISSTGAGTFASLQASNLSGTGTRPLVADASGNIDDQDAATFRATIGIQSVGRRLWAEKEKAETYANNERSILGATAAQRKVAANTISDGTVIRLVAVGRFQASSSGSTLIVKFTCGPDGNYSDPYYFASSGIPCAALTSASGYKVEALLYFVGSGASAGVYVELTIQFFGADGVVTTYRNASIPGSPLAVDGSIDRYLDIFFQVSGGTSSYSTITPTHSFAEIVTP